MSCARRYALNRFHKTATISANNSTVIIRGIPTGAQSECPIDPNASLNRPERRAVAAECGTSLTWSYTNSPITVAKSGAPNVSQKTLLPLSRTFAVYSARSETNDPAARVWNGALPTTYTPPEFGVM
jgi:hypothetical protein